MPKIHPLSPSSATRLSIPPSVISSIIDITEHLKIIQNEYLSFDSLFKKNKTHNNLIIHLHKILILINNILKIIVRIHNRLNIIKGGHRSLKKELAKYVKLNNEKIPLQENDPLRYILLNFEFMVNIIYMLMVSYKTKAITIPLIDTEQFRFISAVLHITENTGLSKPINIYFSNYVEYVNSNNLFDIQNPEINDLIQEGELEHISKQISDINDTHFFSSLQNRFRDLGAFSHY